MNGSQNEEQRYASDAQFILARLYQYVSIISLLIIAAGFALYVSGLLPAKVPVEQVRSYWHLEAGAYATETGTPAGWSFLKSLSRGESVSFGSLVFIPVAVIVCLIIMILTFWKKKNRLFALIAFLQTVLLVLAASGVI